MIKTFHKGYPVPWSSRRETVGLMGTFLVFMLGLQGHSEPVIESAKHLVGQWVRLVLVFLGLVTPMAQGPVTALAPTPAVAPHPVRVTPRHKPAVAKADLNSMKLRREPILHRFNYLFDGIATWHQKPCANASVLVRLVSGERTVVKGTVTNDDGSYSIDVGIDAEDQAPVDWTVEAYTADFNKVELAGRRIVQRIEEHELQPITVTTPVDFVATISK